MDKPIVLFNVPLHRLKPIAKEWFKEVILEFEFSGRNHVVLIDSDQLGAKLSVTKPTIQRWRDQGRIPYIQVGNVIRYDFEKVVEALESKKRR